MYLKAVFRGYRIRKTFLERKKLLMKHEQLRKDAAKYVFTHNGTSNYGDASSCVSTLSVSSVWINVLLISLGIKKLAYHLPEH